MAGYDFNEINIIENGFLNEFRLAQQNLQANIAASRGNTFRYFGEGTGTVPCRSSSPTSAVCQRRRSATQRTTRRRSSPGTTFVNPMARFNPQPFNAANACWMQISRGATMR